MVRRGRKKQKKKYFEDYVALRQQINRKCYRGYSSKAIPLGVVEAFLPNEQRSFTNLKAKRKRLILLLARFACVCSGSLGL